MVLRLLRVNFKNRPISIKLKDTNGTYTETVGFFAVVVASSTRIEVLPPRDDFC
ncbi:MAG TPA: hypothetical protein VIK55_16350 [Paludibacter sp.]